MDKVPRKRTFQLSAIIPFGAKLVVERIGCDLGNWEPDPDGPPDGSGDGGDDDGPQTPGSGGGEKDGRKDYVRILVK